MGHDWATNAFTGSFSEGGEPRGREMRCLAPAFLYCGERSLCFAGWSCSWVWRNEEWLGDLASSRLLLHLLFSSLLLRVAPGLEFLPSGCIPLAIAAARYCLRGPVLAGGSLFTPSLSLPPSVAPVASCSCPCSGVQGGGCASPYLSPCTPWVCLSLLHYWHSTTCLLSFCTVFWCLQALLMISFVFGFCSLCSFVMILKSATPLSWGCNSPF